MAIEPTNTNILSYEIARKDKNPFYAMITGVAIGIIIIAVTGSDTGCWIGFTIAGASLLAHFIWTVKNPLEVQKDE